jgi:aromatic-L-amino-acid decarboxylase
MAARLAAWVDADSDFERMAPVPFSTVCFRFRPASIREREDEPVIAGRLDDLNLRLMEAVNATGQAFLSHTRLNGRFTIRVAISNLRTEDADLDLVWAIVKREAAALDGSI